MNVTDEMIDAAAAVLCDEEVIIGSQTYDSLAAKILRAALDVADTPCCCGVCGV